MVGSDPVGAYQCLQWRNRNAHYSREVQHLHSDHGPFIPWCHQWPLDFLCFSCKFPIPIRWCAVRMTGDITLLLWFAENIIMGVACEAGIAPLLSRIWFQRCSRSFPFHSVYKWFTTRNVDSEIPVSTSDLTFWLSAWIVLRLREACRMLDRKLTLVAFLNLSPC